MKIFRLILIVTILPFVTLAQTDATTLTKIGDTLPAFSFQIEKGKTVDISDYKGKLILINLFATWCPPCNIELPEIQKLLWNKQKDNPNFAFFVFGREEGWEKLEPYKKAKGFTFPILPDVDRGIFKQFATQGIPRNILVDETGKIIYQSIGYEEKEFKEMLKMIETKLNTFKAK